MINAHADAIIALLDADNVVPALVVFKGGIPKTLDPTPSPPYVVVYFADTDPEAAESRSLTGRSERFVQRAYCHCVGGNESAALSVAQRVRAALLDVVPTVAGRQCFPIRREDSQPPRRDESTGQVIQDRVDTYRLESLPA